MSDTAYLLEERDFSPYPPLPKVSETLITVVGVGRFKPLKPEKIHLKCRRCTATRSNMDRSEFDPTNAVVMVLNYCPRCDKGGEFEETTYYDTRGNEIIDDYLERPLKQA